MNKRNAALLGYQTQRGSKLVYYQCNFSATFYPCVGSFGPNYFVHSRFKKKKKKKINHLKLNPAGSPSL